MFGSVLKQFNIVFSDNCKFSLMKDGNDKINTRWELFLFLFIMTYFSETGYSFNGEKPENDVKTSLQIDNVQMVARVTGAPLSGETLISPNNTGP